MRGQAEVIRIIEARDVPGEPHHVYRYEVGNDESEDFESVDHVFAPRRRDQPPTAPHLRGAVCRARPWPMDRRGVARGLIRARLRRAVWAQAAEERAQVLVSGFGCLRHTAE